MRIFVDENIPLGQEAFAPYGEVVRFPGRKLKHIDLGDCQALIVRSITQVNASLLEGTQVRFVGTATIGTDHVDQAWLAQQGIAFASAPGCNANSVGEYIVAALLDLQAFSGLHLDGATLGIVGYGHVGQKVKAKAEAMGLRVLLNDPPRQNQGYAEDFQSLETLLQACDILSLHVPLTDGGPYPTRHLFNRASLEKTAKPIALLNTCRGEVIEAEALLEGKRSGKIAQLVLDVFPGEPNPSPSIWRLCDRLTPHIAGYSLQGKLGGTTQVLQAFCKTFGLKTLPALTEPEPLAPVIDLKPEGNRSSQWEMLRSVVNNAYSISEDDTRLRKALESDDPAGGFDRLRRDYPIRHEFTKFKVRCNPSVDSNVQALLRRWGFGVV